MSRTIKVIERHMIPRSTTQSIQYPEGELVAEWQQREPETISRLTLRKLRLPSRLRNQPRLVKPNH
jgi:hypothetical protein